MLVPPVDCNKKAASENLLPSPEVQASPGVQASPEVQDLHDLASRTSVSMVDGRVGKQPLPLLLLLVGKG
jgi:hypothetical protein